jgi:1,4-alpha-glucan branching enzyme
MSTITLDRPDLARITEHIKASYNLQPSTNIGDLSNICIPCPNAQSVQIRYLDLPRHGKIGETLEPKVKLELEWKYADLKNKGDGWWEIDLSTLKLPDGEYEYEFVVTRNNEELIEADPYAEEITRFGGYRGVFQIKNGQRVRPDFSWDDEINSGKPLPNNNEIVIYELPIRWVDSCPESYDRHVGLGTFDQVIFEKLKYFIELGVNAIELLPVQDSPDTLNWGYGTRFFFTTDYDMGSPIDLKLFVKLCHQNGIRVIMDVVMNHASSKCPLNDLAHDWFFVNAQKDRDAWGGVLFWYDNPINGKYYSRDFQYAVMNFLIKEYHIDGFRLDEFKGIKNYDFVEEFRTQAWDIQQKTFPGRPFIVIAEDSWRRAEITQNLNLCNHKISKVVDSMWDFTFRDELRRLVSNSIHTNYGEPSRSDHMKALIKGDRVIDVNHWRQMFNAWFGKDVDASYSDSKGYLLYFP